MVDRPAATAQFVPARWAVRQWRPPGAHAGIWTCLLVAILLLSCPPAQGQTLRVSAEGGLVGHFTVKETQGPQVSPDPQIARERPSVNTFYQQLAPAVGGSVEVVLPRDSADAWIPLGISYRYSRLRSDDAVEGVPSLLGERLAQHQIMAHGGYEWASGPDVRLYGIAGLGIRVHMGKSDLDAPFEKATFQYPASLAAEAEFGVRVSVSSALAVSPHLRIGYGGARRGSATYTADDGTTVPFRPTGATFLADPSIGLGLSVSYSVYRF